VALQLVASRVVLSSIELDNFTLYSQMSKASLNNQIRIKCTLFFLNADLLNVTINGASSYYLNVATLYGFILRTFENHR
jgi:hypothetical protein